MATPESNTNEKHSTVTPSTFVLDCTVHSYVKVTYSDAVYFVLVSQRAEFIEQIALQINDRPLV